MDSSFFSIGAARAIGLFAVLCAMHWPVAAQQTCRNNVTPDAPDSRFTVHADGTVSDLQTGLMWRRCAEGRSGSACQTGSSVAKNWLEALRGAAESTFAGYTDWRVPNIKELHSLVENACMNPAINSTVFPQSPGAYVWTSTPHAAFADRAWYVGFQYGSDNHGGTLGGLPKSSTAYVMHVR